MQSVMVIVSLAMESLWSWLNGNGNFHGHLPYAWLDPSIILHFVPSTSEQSFVCAARPHMHVSSQHFGSILNRHKSLFSTLRHENMPVQVAI